MLSGVIFDLDNTLVDSGLDFTQMRLDMRLPDDVPILETMAKLPDDHAAHCREVLRQHEEAGLARATLLPGVTELLAEIRRRRWPRGIFTRNSREITGRTLRKFSLADDFHPIVTRDDGPVKPDPWSIRHICAQWRTSPERVVVIGDYRYDVEAGKSAGARTVLLTGSVPTHAYPNEEQADLLLHGLHEWERLLAWWDA
jgi:HAD superfamily hydrolase (TIGR01549 family)